MFLFISKEQDMFLLWIVAATVLGSGKAVQYTAEEWQPVQLDSSKLTGNIVQFSDSIKNALEAILRSRENQDLKVVCQDPTTGFVYWSDMILSPLYFETVRSGVLYSCWTTEKCV